MQSQIFRQFVFTLGVLACGCVELAVAGAWVGSRGLEGVAYSVLLCLVPGWMAIFVNDRLSGTSYSAYAILVGIGARLAFVVAGLLVMKVARPDLGFREFSVWLAVNYLISLALETWAVLLPSSSSVKS